MGTVTMSTTILVQNCIINMGQNQKFILLKNLNYLVQSKHRIKHGNHWLLWQQTRFEKKKHIAIPIINAPNHPSTDKFDNSVILFQAQDKKNMNERFLVSNSHLNMLLLHSTLALINHGSTGRKILVVKWLFQNTFIIPDDCLYS